MKAVLAHLQLDRCRCQPMWYCLGWHRYTSSGVLAQSPLPEVCRTNLRHLPLAPGWQHKRPLIDVCHLQSLIPAMQEQHPPSEHPPTFLLPVSGMQPRTTHRPAHRPQRQSPQPPLTTVRHGSVPPHVSFPPTQHCLPSSPPTSAEKHRQDH